MIFEGNEEEWLACRIGKITGSCMNAVMDLGEGGEFKSGPRKGQPRPVGASRTAYIEQLATERLTGKGPRQIKAAALEHGKEKEPEAVAAYERLTGALVEPGGFITHPLYPFIGVSPDFLIGDDTGGEVKCPINPAVHLHTLIHGLPAEHIEQIQGGLWVSERKRWVFLSFSEDFLETSDQLYIQVIERDEEYISKLEDACLTLEAEVRKIVNSRKKPEAA
jgi:hypothetical protein